MKLEKKLRKKYKFEAPDRLDDIKNSLGLDNTYTPYVKQKSPLIMFKGIICVSAFVLVIAVTYLVRVNNKEANLPTDDVVIVVPNRPLPLGDVNASSKLSLMISNTLGEEQVDVLDYMPKYLDIDTYDIFMDAEEKSKCLNNIYNNLKAVINNANQLNDATDGTYKIPANNYEFIITIKNNKAKINTTIDDIKYEIQTEESDNLLYYYVVIKDENTEISYKYRENDIHINSKEFSGNVHSDLTYLNGYELRNNNGDIKITLKGEGNNKIKAIELKDNNDGTYRIKSDDNSIYVFKDGLIAYYSNNKYYVITNDEEKDNINFSYYNNGELDYKKLYECADKNDFKAYFSYSI